MTLSLEMWETFIRMEMLEVLTLIVKVGPCLNSTPSRMQINRKVLELPAIYRLSPGCMKKLFLPKDEPQEVPI